MVGAGMSIALVRSFGGSMSWDSLDLSQHNHMHRCPRCEEIRWHHGTKASCPESNMCERDQALQDLENTIEELVQEEIAHERSSYPNG